MQKCQTGQGARRVRAGAAWASKELGVKVRSGERKTGGPWAGLGGGGPVVGDENGQAGVHLRLLGHHQGTHSPGSRVSGLIVVRPSLHRWALS